MFTIFAFGVGLIMLSLLFFPKNNPSPAAVANDMARHPGQWLFLLLVMALGVAIVLTIQ